MPLAQSIIRFPEIRLHTRDAHKLRGYFGNLFREHSELLHNHMGNGKLRYAYPQVQYKVLNGVPTLVGIKEGARLLPELFLDIKELNINGRLFPVRQKNIEAHQVEAGLSSQMHYYRFVTHWMAINQSNHRKYLQSNADARQQLLTRILTGNLLSFFKGIDVFVEDRIDVQLQASEKRTRFKNNTMLAFEGTFRANVLLPDYIGLGKQVARGFGTVQRQSTL